ncbi:MAG: exonuclease domain-containing protein [Flavobacteriales bacterium]
MQLHLKKPLAFFDLETTGVDVGKDRIVEIAIVKVMPDGQMHTMPEKGGSNRLLVNPERPIPTEASLIHGVYDADVTDAPTFAQLASKLFKFIFDCDLAGFNSNKFDVPLLAEEFLRAGIDFTLEGRSLVDVQVLFHLMEPRSLKAAYKFYCHKNLEDAHEALADTMATYEVFQAMLNKYEGVSIEDNRGNTITPVVNDVEEIARVSERRKRVDLAGHIQVNEKDEKVFAFGKYKGIPVEEVLQRDRGYYSWMMQADFPLYTKRVLTEIREAMHIQ